jgi:hypothetical protein
LIAYPLRDLIRGYSSLKYFDDHFHGHFGDSAAAPHFMMALVEAIDDSVTSATPQHAAPD